MSKIFATEKYLKELLLDLGYDTDVKLVKSNIESLGQFQLNCAMSLAKKYNENPELIANKIVSKLDNRFTNVNVANHGFINLSFTDEELITYANDITKDFSLLIDNYQEHTIIIDYGGANVAKSLHVGHMRSANIGEALKRLAKLYNKTVLGDVHFGDIGRQAGIILAEYKFENPDSLYFDSSYKGEYPKINITNDDLKRLYPNGSIKANEDEKRMEEVRYYSSLVDKGVEPYLSLWNQFSEVSIKEIKRIYEYLNCTFDLWESEISSFKYLDEVKKIYAPFLKESDNALVIDVKEDNDKVEIPPLIFIKSDGSTIYATRDIATIYGRIKNYNPNEIWYIVDSRQSLHFNQVFRSSYKTKLVNPNCLLAHYSFGTINGKDNKPYKTRDGKVMDLNSLIDIVKEEIIKLLDKEIENYDSTLNTLAISAIKYADLSFNRTTDYTFDERVFSSFDGKTGPYILYTAVRIKSLLSKLNNYNFELKEIYTNEQRELCVKLVNLSNVLYSSYLAKQTNYITDYLFEICNIYNRFYGTYNILNEENQEIKESYIAFSVITLNIITKLLDILAIKTVEKM